MERHCLMRMASMGSKCWEAWRSENSYMQWGENTHWIWKPIQRFLKTVKIKLAYDPTPALDRYPKE